MAAVGSPPRARWTVGGLLSVGVATAVAGLLLLAGVAALQLGAVVHDRVPVERTYEVLRSVADLQTALNEAETGQRGYLFTGEESYLQPYEAALPETRRALAALLEQTSDDVQQQATVKRLEAPLQDKLDELALTVALHRSGNEPEVREVVLSGRGARDMTQLRAVLAQLNDREHDQLERHLADSARQVRTTRQVLAGGAVLTALLVTVGGALVTRRITVPIRRVTEAARRVRLSTRPPCRSCTPRTTP